MKLVNNEILSKVADPFTKFEKLGYNFGWRIQLSMLTWVSTNTCNLVRVELNEASK